MPSFYATAKSGGDAIWGSAKAIVGGRSDGGRGSGAIACWRVLTELGEHALDQVASCCRIGWRLAEHASVLEFQFSWRKRFPDCPVSLDLLFVHRITLPRGLFCHWEAG